MHEDCLIGRAGIGTNEEKATTRVIGDCLDRPYPKSLTKGIFAPRQTLIGGIEDMVGWLLVIY